MKKNNILILLILFFNCVKAQSSNDGYDITITTKNIGKSRIFFLCHYYGGNTKVFKDDSTTIQSDILTFKSSNKITGGMYMVLSEDKSKNIELFLFNGDKLNLSIDGSDIYNTFEIVDKQNVNQDLYEYLSFMNDVSSVMKKSNSIQSKQIPERIEKYKMDYIKNNPNTFLSKMFIAELDKSLFSYDFTDDKLIFTPIATNKFNSYYAGKPENEIIASVDKVVAKINNDKSETYKFYMWYLTKYAENQIHKNLFIYLVENYYQKNKIPWVDKADLIKYSNRAEEYKEQIKQAEIEERIRAQKEEERKQEEERKKIAIAIQNQQSSSSSQSSNVSNNRIELLRSYFNQQINSICPGSVEIVELSEISGQAGNFMGAEIYEIKFNVKLKFLKTGHVNSQMINSGHIPDICRTAKVFQGAAVKDPYGTTHQVNISAGEITSVKGNQVFKIVNGKYTIQ